MRPGFTISTAFHAVVLGWGLIHFASVKPVEAPPVDSLPIDLVSISDFTKSRQGILKAEKQPDPVKQVEKQAEPKEKVDPNLPVKQKDVKSTPPPPPPVEKQEEPKKEEPKKEVAKPDPAPSPDAIAKKLEEEQKKTEKKKDPPKKVVKEKAPPVKTKHNFDPDRIAELLDRRAPSRKENTGEQKSQTNLGTPKGADQTLSMSELDAFRRHVQKCWNVLPGAGNMESVVVVLRIRLNPDGTLASQPQLITPVTSPIMRATAESAVRAVVTCAPFKMFRQQTYPVWKDMEVGFDSREMLS
jgi:outer membrane biosynthesis protein TonB